MFIIFFSVFSRSGFAFPEMANAGGKGVPCKQLGPLTLVSLSTSYFTDAQRPPSVRQEWLERSRPLGWRGQGSPARLDSLLTAGWGWGNQAGKEALRMGWVA